MQKLFFLIYKYMPLYLQHVSQVSELHISSFVEYFQKYIFFEQKITQNTLTVYKASAIQTEE